MVDSLCWKERNILNTRMTVSRTVLVSCWHYRKLQLRGSKQQRALHFWRPKALPESYGAKFQKKARVIPSRIFRGKSILCLSQLLVAAGIPWPHHSSLCFVTSLSLLL